MKIPLTADIINGFVGSLLLKDFDGQYKTPECHLEWWNLCCSPERYVAIAAPRRHAKSTAITISYTLANVLFQNRKFVLLVSDTESQAILFLGQIKQQLQDNRDLVALFGLQTDAEGNVKFVKDTESDIIVAFNDGTKFRIIAKGAEQKLRGLLWDGQRPDLILIDDLENEELVMNKDRREKLRRWFYGSLMPCLSKDGIIRYVGTILHQDALLERFMPIPGNRDVHITDLKTSSTRRIAGWKSVKYRAHNPDFSQILWPDAWPAQRLRDERAGFMEQGLPDVYSQEFLNQPIDENTTFFKKSDFVPITEEDRKKKLNYYIASDMAISTKETADWTVFVVGGVDEDGRLHIVNVIRERLDGLAIVDTMLALQRLYSPMLFGVEETQISKSIGPFLNLAMLEQNTYISLYPLKPHKSDKVSRARSIQARLRAHGVKFDRQADWFPVLEDEMMSFPRGRHDDIVDSMSYLGLIIDKLLEAPTNRELEEERYAEDMENSEMYEQGRSQICGY